MEYETAAISSLKRQADTVYDGRISQVKPETALIYRIQCGRIRGLIWYGRSGHAAPRKAAVVCFQAVAVGLKK